MKNHYRDAELVELSASCGHFATSNRFQGSLAEPAGLRSTCFSARERAALMWAEHIAANTAKHRDDIYRDLQQHFNHAEIVELTGLCAMANQVDRIYNALHVPLESAAEIRRLNRTATLDPDVLKAYLESMLAFWPRQFPVPAD